MSNVRTSRADSAEREETGVFGDCIDCDQRHSLSEGQAKAYALDMMQEFEKLQRLDYLARDAESDPQLRFQNLFAERGNMFGVLECVDARGETVILRAFSSLSGGIRMVEGWVLPVLNAAVYDGTILPAQQEIKRLSAELESLRRSGRSTVDVEERRRGVSQVLWEKMCSEYHFQNFRGDVRVLAKAVLPGTPISGGMGECCAPKLLNHAARNGLRPRGIAEFYWGGAAPNPRSAETRDDEQEAPSPRRSRRQTPKTRRVSGQFYPSCEARCQPILGFLLCGLET